MNRLQDNEFVNAIENDAAEKCASNRTQYIIHGLLSLTKYKNDVFFNASVNCFLERLNASKVLLIKEPLEALDKCTNSSCYNDVEIEMELTVEEIADQMKKCLDQANASGPLYDDLLKVIEYVDVRTKSSIDMLIDKLNSDDNGISRETLHKLITIAHKLEDGDSVTVNQKDRNIAEFVKELLA